MVAPPQQVPPQGPPPGVPGLPPQIAQVAGQLGVPPEALAQALAPLAQRLAQAGVDPGVLLDFIVSIPPQAVGQFLGAPPDQQLQALAEFVRAVQSGQVGPPSAPPPGADLNQPTMGPPVGGPPGPVGPRPGPLGPPSPLPGVAPPPGTAAPLPPNVTPIEQGRRKRQGEQPAAEREPPPPDDVELPDLEDVAGDSPYWTNPPSPAQVRRDAQLGRQRWRADYEFIFDQVGAYRMFKDYFGADGRPLRPGLGEVQYKLASFARMVDRAASQAEPRPDEEVLEIPPRAEDRDTKQRTQKAENLLRTRDERERAWWNRRTSRGLVEPPIRTKKFRLLALEGSYAVLYRLHDVGGKAPKAGKKSRPPELLFTREPLSVTEVFPLAHATTVQRRMTFAEACAAEPAVLEQMKERAKKRGKDFDPEDSSWGVSERTTVVLGEWYDADGLHRLVYWDWGSPDTVGADIRDPSDNGADFFIAKARLDWGFCPVQICPPWNADPSPEGKRGRGAASTTARDTGANAAPTRRRYVGAGGKELETQDWKDRIASIMLTNLVGNTHPYRVRRVDPNMYEHYDKDASGRPIIPAPQLGPGQQDVIFGPNEEILWPDRNVSAGQDAALAINILGGESQDAQPAVLGGRGPATSGFETMQRNDAAQSLHVEPMRRAYEDFETYLRGLDLELYLRAGEGEGKLWDELPFRGAVMGAPGNEGTIDVSDLKRAGTYATVTISADDPIAELQKNRIHLERLKAKVESPMTVMRELGIKDPDEETNLIVENDVINGNPKVQDVLGLRAMKAVDWESYLAYLNSTAPGPGQQGAGGQPGTPPGGPGPQMAPAPGVPTQGLPSVMG